VSLTPGTRLGQYEIVSMLGEGGMGAVYRAEHALLKRPAALKLLLPERTGPENLARFEREVRLTAQLTHPNTVAVYDYGHTPDGQFYYAMEYLDGLTLEALVKRYGPQPPARVIYILAQAAGALAEAHALGLIHRDVKPANILFCDRGGVPDVVKLVDFGLAKSVSTEASPALTQAGTLAGTPLYLSPEAISDAARVDHRADLYALGGVGYYELKAPDSAGYAYWSAGVGYDFEPWHLEIAWFGTSSAAAELFDETRPSNRLAATLIWRF